jgi:hypothetical protein
MDKKQGILQLHASGMSNRQIARALGINRKSVDSLVSHLDSKRATSAEAPTGKALTGSNDSKRAKAPTGSDAALEPGELTHSVAPEDLNVAAKEEASFAQSRSKCVQFHDVIVAKVEQGLTPMDCKSRAHVGGTPMSFIQ